MASAHTNDSFCDPNVAIEYRPLRLPMPIFALAVQAPSKKDEDKMTEFFLRACEEDKTLKLRYNGETRQSVLSGMGEMHLQLLFDRLRKSLKIEAQTSTPRVSYRETISAVAEAEYTHKKQSGGHGQFARVVLRVSPLDRGGGFAFVNEVHGGAISKNYLPGVEKGIIDGMCEGALAGYPVMDLQATVLDGKEHPVDSSDLAFQLAARFALKEALPKAKPVLLEPIFALRVYIEDSYLGVVLSDLSAKRGRVLGQQVLGGGIVEIDAEVPQAELLHYAIDLKAMTSGTGSFELDFDHYAVLSGRHAEDVVKASAHLKTETT
jgi:elongation factor G